jgi:hypothetical protein
LWISVDNYVNNGYKGHRYILSFWVTFSKNMLKNKDILIKDIKI